MTPETSPPQKRKIKSHFPKLPCARFALNSVTFTKQQYLTVIELGPTATTKIPPSLFTKLPQHHCFLSPAFFYQIRRKFLLGSLKSQFPNWHFYWETQKSVIWRHYPFALYLLKHDIDSFISLWIFSLGSTQGYFCQTVHSTTLFTQEISTHHPQKTSIKLGS